MFLVEDRRAGLHNFVFAHTNPRIDGFTGELIEGVDLDYDMNAIYLWPSGEPRPTPQLGSDPANPKHYKVFRSIAELQSEGYEFVHSNAPIVVYSWREYRQMFPVPSELAEKLDSDEWFDYLDEIDAANRLRRKRDVNPDPPEGSDLNLIAEWVAKQHLSADGSVRQVIYLPSGAPPDEIRLLEVSERIVNGFERVEPMDIGTEVAGVPLNLSVADITPDQLVAIANDPTLLPKGWSLEGVQVFDGWRNRRIPA